MEYLGGGSCLDLVELAKSRSLDEIANSVS